jgi:hypothetical protein
MPKIFLRQYRHFPEDSTNAQTSSRLLKNALALPGWGPAHSV